GSRRRTVLGLRRVGRRRHPRRTSGDPVRGRKCIPGSPVSEARPHRPRGDRVADAFIRAPHNGCILILISGPWCGSQPSATLKKKECHVRTLTSFFTILVFVAILAALTAPLPAQVLYGSILGTVQDPSSAVIPQAKVTLLNKATGVSRVAE